MRKSVVVVLAGLLLVLAGCGKLGATAGSAEPQSGDTTVVKMQQIATEQALQPGATEKQVLALVGAASKIKKVPAELAVPVSGAIDDGPEAGWDGCLAAESAAQVPDTCVYGDKEAKKTVVLYGDSHAGMWASAFDVAGKRTHAKIVLLAKPACAVPTLHFWLETTQRQNTECDAWHTWATDKIVSLKPDTIVLTSLFQGPRDFDKKEITEAAWSAGMKTTIKKVGSSGAKVVVLGDMPYLEQSAPECLAAHASDVAACGRAADESIFAEHGAAEKATAKATGATYVDTTPWFCTDVCSPIIGDMVVYQNEYHITAVYSRYLSGVVATAVGMA
jgi:hypothetical protein